MRTKLKTWPKKWVEHITQACMLYFEDKDIDFINSFVLSSGSDEDATMYGIKLEFKKNTNTYDILISHDNGMFAIDYYYKRYKVLNKTEDPYYFTSSMDGLLNGNDSMGLFIYEVLGLELSMDSISSAYGIVQNIEAIINYHGGSDDDDDDDDDDKDPVEPYSPIDMVKPELIGA